MLSSNLKFKIFLNLMILIFLFTLFNLPRNLNKLINHDYEDRLNDIYGYCFPQGYGFIEEIKGKYKFSNIKTINFEDFAPSDFFLNNPSKKKLTDYMILINYDENKHKNFLLKDYEIIFKKQKCYLIKK